MSVRSRRPRVWYLCRQNHPSINGILVSFYGSSNGFVCDPTGVTTAITFTHNPGDVPSLNVATSSLTTTGATASVFVRHGGIRWRACEFHGVAWRRELHCSHDVLQEPVEGPTAAPASRALASLWSALAKAPATTTLGSASATRAGQVRAACCLRRCGMSPHAGVLCCWVSASI
jgi:hypothetical protein